MPHPTNPLPAPRTVILQRRPPDALRPPRGALAAGRDQERLREIRPLRDAPVPAAGPRRRSRSAPRDGPRRPARRERRREGGPPRRASGHGTRDRTPTVPGTGSFRPIAVPLPSSPGRIVPKEERTRPSSSRTVRRSPGSGKSPVASPHPESAREVAHLRAASGGGPGAELRAARSAPPTRRAPPPRAVPGRGSTATRPFRGARRCRGPAPAKLLPRSRRPRPPREARRRPPSRGGPSPEAWRLSPTGSPREGRCRGRGRAVVAPEGTAKKRPARERQPRGAQPERRPARPSHPRRQEGRPAPERRSRRPPGPPRRAAPRADP